jgi:hypothetical protein
LAGPDLTNEIFWFSLGKNARRVTNT